MTRYGPGQLAGPVRGEKLMHKQAGFTLIELIVAMVVMAILAAVAVPSYRAYVTRAQRSDAKAALLRLVTAQEKFYLQNNRYAIDGERDDAPPAGLGVDTSERGWYTLAITQPTDVDLATEGFTVTATAAAGGQQINDTDCREFQVDDRGVRTASDADDEDSTDQCW
jgi:type IV pilus assembly protein PilE